MNNRNNSNANMVENNTKTKKLELWLVCADYRVYCTKYVCNMGEPCAVHHFNYYVPMCLSNVCWAYASGGGFCATILSNGWISLSFGIDIFSNFFLHSLKMSTAKSFLYSLIFVSPNFYLRGCSPAKSLYFHIFFLPSRFASPLWRYLRAAFVFSYFFWHRGRT